MMVEIKELFKHSNSDWIKYSDYEYKATPEGELYLTPAENATISIVNPLQAADALLVDALNIGHLCMPEQPDMPKIKAQILAFVKQYGLLGLMTSYPLKLDFIEKKEVLLNTNPLTDKSVMKTAAYLKHFLPFCTDTAIMESPHNNIAGVETSSLPITMFMDRPPVYEIVFSNKYAEKFDWLMNAFRYWYVHLGACSYYDKTEEDIIRQLHVQTMQTFSMQGLSYRIKLVKTPTIVWEFPSLKAAIDALYSFYVTDPERPLRICKHCGKAFVAKNRRTEFCTVPCRNQFNVYKSRRKQGG